MIGELGLELELERLEFYEKIFKDIFKEVWKNIIWKNIIKKYNWKNIALKKFNA